MSNDKIAPPDSEETRLAEARRRVAAMKGFYIHLAVFALIVLGLLVINVASGAAWWAHWVFLGWGIGIVAHALAVFGRLPRAIADWEERKVRQLMSER
jgi:uncharacterized membrane protein YdjX (TVP38/TMEM64 family)